MKALVLYYSQFGNTERIARAVAAVLPERAHLRATSLSEVRPADLVGLSWLIMGAPTHFRDVPRVVAKFLDRVPRHGLRGVRVAVFDTRYRMARWLSGSAARKLARRVRRLGGALVVPPESFFVADREGPCRGCDPRAPDATRARARLITESEWVPSFVSRTRGLRMPRAGCSAAEASRAFKPGHPALPAVLAIAMFPFTLCAQELVSFPTGDGGVVYADLYGAGDRGVVLAHGGRFTKESWAAQAERLIGAGFRVVAIDFRGRGRSRGPEGGSRDDGVHFDVLAAVRYLRQTGAQTVSVVGASFGGGAAAQATVEAMPGEIERVVLLAHSAIDEPERMQGRKLFITARGDTTGSGALRLPRIREQYERAPEPKKLVLLDGAAHAQFLFETEHAVRLMNEILTFLTEP